MSTPAPLGLHPALDRAIDDLGFETPTPIQAEAIPMALQGRDILASAETGSGKTAAFLIPTIHRLITGPKRKGPRVLVLTPTRELAVQVANDFKKLSAHTRLRNMPIYGGVAMPPQVRAFKSGVEALIATPGRLLDHLQHGYAQLNNIEVLILDEADRMLDMGFLPDIRRILEHCPKQRQTLFFSATMPKAIKTLSDQILRDPHCIAVERRAAPAAGVRQQVIPVAQLEKSKLLLNVLARDEVRSVLCFTRTKHRADRLTDFLEKRGVRAARIHGNRSQGQRQRALDAFRKGRVHVLVATDVAARGIDVDHITHVVNFDVPRAPEDYIHRVGRTGRANREGDAVTFVSREEESHVRGIEKALKQRIERAPRFGAPEAAGEPRNAKGSRGKKPYRPNKRSAKGKPTFNGPPNRSKSRAAARRRAR